MTWDLLPSNAFTDLGHTHAPKAAYRFAIVGAALCSMIVLSAGAANASNLGPAMSGQAHTTKAVKPDFSFYVGKTLTFDTGGAPGGAYDEFALSIGPLMASYLHCTINVVDNPNGATAVAADAGAASTPNGLTFASGGLDGYLDDDVAGTTNVNFPLKTQEYIGGYGPPPYVITTSPSSGIRRLSTLLRTPGEKWLELVGEGTSIDNTLIHAYKIPSPAVVTGYSNGAALQTGLLRGDGNVASQAIAQVFSNIEAGQFIPVAVTIPEKKGDTDYAQLAKLPVLSTYIASHEPKSRADRSALNALNTLNSAATNMLFAPVGTPEKYVAALTDAFHSAFLQKGEQAFLIQQGISNTYVTPAESLREINLSTSAKVVDAIKPFIN
jgi:tripartite-type tricarboxylate transporter receptor subunit TctC